jgi:hypothetical protein
MPQKYRIKRVLLTEEELHRRLADLEQRHGMTSDEFLVRYNRGELGDDLEFIRWSGLLRTASKARGAPASRR